MLPRELSANHFQRYPAEARRQALDRISLLRRLPLGFVPLLLRELIAYDWKFPAERKDIDRQFSYLTSLSEIHLANALKPFAQLQLPVGLEKTDWVNAPAVFTEQLTAHLWGTHQIDAFRAAAIGYMDKANAAFPDKPLAVKRLAIVLVGQGVRDKQRQLFRKLRPLGVHFTGIRHEKGLKSLTSAVAARSAAHPEPYGHWYIDGGPAAVTAGGVTTISYAGIASARLALQTFMRQNYQASVFDPEAFRTRLARTRPEEIGLNAPGSDPILNQFQLSLLTEGSGTQVFSTTFVQWAAREAFRRAQPLTMLVRYSPRQREKPMNELLAETQRTPELDPEGSLVDAEMGAYYTWLNQQRLSGADEASFLVWFEDHGEAVAIGPNLERGKHRAEPVELLDLVEQLSI